MSGGNGMWGCLSFACLNFDDSTLISDVESLRELIVIPMLLN